MSTTSRLTLSSEAARSDPLYDVHTDETEKHQGNWQLCKMIKLVSSVHLYLQQEGQQFKQVCIKE